MAESKRRVRGLAITAGCVLSGLLLFVFVFYERLEKPVLRLAGVFIGGVNNHRGAFAIGVAVAFIAIWVLIGAICLLESRRSQR